MNMNSVKQKIPNFISSHFLIFFPHPISLFLSERVQISLGLRTLVKTMHFIRIQEGFISENLTSDRKKRIVGRPIIRTLTISTDRLVCLLIDRIAETSFWLLRESDEFAPFCEEGAKKRESDIR